MILAGALHKHRTFIGNIAAMMSGKTLAAAIALVTMPIVARLFSPDDFGVAAAFLALVGIVSNIGTLRYERALVLPKADAEAIVLMALTYRILLGVCLLMLVVVAIYEVTALQWPIFELLGVWRWLLPLGVLLSAGLQVQESWLGRQAAFKLVAASTVLGTVVNGAIRIGSGFVWGTTIAGLISSNLIGMFSRTVVQRAASVEGLNSIFRHFSFVSLRQTAVSYRDFPQMDAPAGLVFSLGQNLPVLLFGTLFSPAAAGLYAMANRLSQVPIKIVSSSVRRVFLREAATIKNRGGPLLKAFLMTTGALLAAGVIPFTVIWLYGQPLLGGLLGERWLEAGRYLEIMAPWLLMMWVMAPSNPVFVVLRKQNIWLILQTGLTILRLGAFGLAYLVEAGPEWTLQAFVVATVAGNIVTIFVALKFIAGSSQGPISSDSPPAGKTQL